MLSSNNCASSSGRTGSSATMSTASSARRRSVSAAVGGRSAATGSTLGPHSAVVGVDQDGVDHSVLAQPLDLDGAERAVLYQLDVALLVQLEHREEPHDHLEAADQL